MRSMYESKTAATENSAVSPSGASTRSPSNMKVRDHQFISDQRLLATLLALAILAASVLTFAGEDPENAGQDFQNESGGAIGNEDSDPAPGVSLGTPVSGGTGCPDGTVMSALSPDQRELAIIFSAFETKAGASMGARQALNECTIQIPVSVPQGYRLQVVKFDYRGFANAARGGRVVLASRSRTLDYNTGSPILEGQLRRRRFLGPVQTEFNITARSRNLRDFSQCGRSVVVEVMTRQRAVAGAGGEESQIALDSVDATGVGSNRAEMKYHLRWKRCR